MPLTTNHSGSRSGTSSPRVLLTDTNRWPAPARIAIGLAKSGCTVAAVCPTRGHPLLYTSAVQRSFPYRSLRPLESLLAAIEAFQPDVIVPCDDRGVMHLHELYDRACKQGASGTPVASLLERSLGSPDSFVAVSCRSRLLDIARQEGIRVPDSQPLSGLEDLEAWQAGHAFPWVLKGDGTFGGRGVRIAHSFEEASKHYSDIRRMFGAIRAFKRALINRDPFWLRPWWQNHQPAVTVQSYVLGRPANCAVVCWKGRVLAGIAVEVVSSVGQTGPASIVRVVDNQEMLEAAERLARSLELSGFFGLDFMIEKKSGAAYLIEMNPRCTPLTHLQLGNGRDMIETFSAQIAGRSPRDVVPVTHNDLIAYFPQSRNTKSEFLQSSYQDVPVGEPRLLQALLEPWPDRSLLFRLAARANVLKSST